MEQFEFDMSKHSIDWGTIRKRIEKELSASEEMEFQRWINFNSENRRFYEKVISFYRNQEAFELNANASWEKLKQKLEKKNDGNVRRLPVRKLLFRMAAASVVFAFISIATFYFLDKDSVQIQPGGNKAILVLSDGTKFYLDTTATELITGDNVKLFAGKDGISYQNQNQPTNTEHTIIIPRGGEYLLTLSDGSKVHLDSESKFTFPTYFGKEQRKVELEGHAYFEIKPDKNRAFVLGLYETEIRVLGTSFDVSSYGKDKNLVATLVEGSVEFVSGGSEESAEKRTILKPGEQVVYSKQDKRVEVKEVDTRYMTAWKDGMFWFYDESLGNIMGKLSRWYNFTYEFQEEDLGSVHLSGRLKRYDDVKTMLNLFEKTNRVVFDIDNMHISVKKPESVVALSGQNN